MPAFSLPLAGSGQLRLLRAPELGPCATAGVQALAPLPAASSREGRPPAAVSSPPHSPAAAWPGHDPGAPRQQGAGEAAGGWEQQREPHLLPPPAGTEDWLGGCGPVASLVRLPVAPQPAQLRTFGGRPAALQPDAQRLHMPQQQLDHAALPVPGTVHPGGRGDEGAAGRWQGIDAVLSTYQARPPGLQAGWRTAGLLQVLDARLQLPDQQQEGQPAQGAATVDQGQAGWQQRQKLQSDPEMAAADQGRLNAQQAQLAGQQGQAEGQAWLQVQQCGQHATSGAGALRPRYGSLGGQPQRPPTTRQLPPGTAAAAAADGRPPGPPGGQGAALEGPAPPGPSTAMIAATSSSAVAVPGGAPALAAGPSQDPPPALGPSQDSPPALGPSQDPPQALGPSQDPPPPLGPSQDPPQALGPSQEPAGPAQPLSKLLPKPHKGCQSPVKSPRKLPAGAAARRSALARLAQQRRGGGGQQQHQDENRPPADPADAGEKLVQHMQQLMATPELARRAEHNAALRSAAAADALLDALNSALHCRPQQLPSEEGGPPQQQLPGEEGGPPQQQPPEQQSEWQLQQPEQGGAAPSAGTSLEGAGASWAGAAAGPGPGSEPGQGPVQIVLRVTNDAGTNPEPEPGPGPAGRGRVSDAGCMTDVQLAVSMPCGAPPPPLLPPPEQEHEAAAPQQQPAETQQQQQAQQPQASDLGPAATSHQQAAAELAQLILSAFQHSGGVIAPPPAAAQQLSPWAQPQAAAPPVQPQASSSGEGPQFLSVTDLHAPGQTSLQQQRAAQVAAARAQMWAASGQLPGQAPAQARTWPPPGQPRARPALGGSAHGGGAGGRAAGAGPCGGCGSQACRHCADNPLWGSGLQAGGTGRLTGSGTLAASGSRLAGAQLPGSLTGGEARPAAVPQAGAQAAEGGEVAMMRWVAETAAARDSGGQQAAGAAGFSSMAASQVRVCSWGGACTPSAAAPCHCHAPARRPHSCLLNPGRRLNHQS
jgi:hypothetical protein